MSLGGAYLLELEQLTSGYTNEENDSPKQPLTANSSWGRSGVSGAPPLPKTEYC